MPVALPIDKDLAKELYTNGMPLKQVSDRTGVKLSTLSQWKTRGQWDEHRLLPEGDSIRAVEQTAKALSNQTLTISSRILCKLEKMAMDSPREVKDIATALSSAYLTARRALGLDDDARARNVSVTFVNAKFGGDTPEQPVIDVTPEPSDTLDAQSAGESAAPNV